MMNYRKQIEIHLKESGGIITSAYCREDNIPTVYLGRLVKEGKLFRVQKGIYIIEDGDFDEHYFFQYQYGKAILSYETASFLPGVTNKTPWRVNVTVYNGYRFNEKQDILSANYVKKSIYNLGIIRKKTMFGNIVNAHPCERIFCDFISNKEKMDTEVYVKLTHPYSKYKDKNIHSLYEIARKMGIEDKVGGVMEVVYEQSKVNRHLS